MREITSELSKIKNLAHDVNMNAAMSPNLLSICISYLFLFVTWTSRRIVYSLVTIIMLTVRGHLLGKLLCNMQNKF